MTALVLSVVIIPIPSRI